LHSQFAKFDEKNLKKTFAGAKIQKMWQTILISVGILLISFVFLAIKVLFVKNGSFPKTHVSQSKAMRDKGIHCVQTQDYEDRHKKGLYDEGKIPSSSDQGK
jgi:hypothetical protein